MFLRTQMLKKSSYLSVMVGFVAAIWSASRPWEEHLAFSRSMSIIEDGYLCAAQFDEQELERHETRYGTIDLSGTRCAVKNLFVRREELEKFKAGRLDFENRVVPAFRPTALVLAFIKGTCLGLIATLSVVSLVALGRWIWRDMNSG